MANQLSTVWFLTKGIHLKHDQDHGMQSGSSVAASLQTSWESVLPPSPIRVNRTLFNTFPRLAGCPLGKTPPKFKHVCKNTSVNGGLPKDKLQVLYGQNGRSCRGHDPTWLAVMHLRWWIVNWTTPKRYCRFCKGSLLFSGKSRHGLGEISSARTLGWLENLEAKLEASKSESLKTGELSDMMRLFYHLVEDFGRFDSTSKWDLRLIQNVPCFKTLLHQLSLDRNPMKEMLYCI